RATDTMDPLPVPAAWWETATSRLLSWLKSPRTTWVGPLPTLIPATAVNEAPDSGADDEPRLLIRKLRLLSCWSARTMSGLPSLLRSPRAMLVMLRPFWTEPLVTVD